MPRHAGTDHDFLAMALVGYEAEKAKIDAAIREIQAQLGHRGPKATTAPATRTLSASARKRIAAAQRKRWAAVRKAKAQAKPKRRLSAAARKSIGNATRKRWAAVRKAAAKKAKPVAKVATAGA